MIIAIPLGGLGSRFAACGYTTPKPLVQVLGKPIICWLLDCICKSRALSSVAAILIPYHRVLAKYRLEAFLRQRYPHLPFRFLQLEKDTNGAVQSLALALDHLADDHLLADCPLLSLDGDNFYACDVVDKFLVLRGNVIFTFEDVSSGEEAPFSYVERGQQASVVRIVEKKKVSNNAATGAYGFDSWEQLRGVCHGILDTGGFMAKGEYYLSGAIQKLIESGSAFAMTSVALEDYVCLGTPLHVRLFCNNHPVVHALSNQQAIDRKRFCFDLDNTLVTFPVVEGDYSTVRPIPEVVDMVRYLKKMGHTIIIYTARRMRTHCGNVGRILQDVGEVTLRTLADFDVPYDEIYFGKPHADAYVDDLAVLPFGDDLEKGLGFYRSLIQPRSFHSFEETSHLRARKTGADLSGEIYYYQNVPVAVKDLFPVFFEAGEQLDWYEMERISGVVMSDLYVSELLTVAQLRNILGSVRRLHSAFSEEAAKSSCAVKGVDIYSCYGQKLAERYGKHRSRYGRLKEAEQVYASLMGQLDKYVEKDLGKHSMIHGDPVFTNILVTQFGKIKFVDMRGKMGEKQTIFGDKLYDWAKVYQSLIGYDEIIRGKETSVAYKHLFVATFKAFMAELYPDEPEVMDNISLVTRSLLFSLIPLHDESKNDRKFMDLIMSL